MSILNRALTLLTDQWGRFRSASFLSALTPTVGQGDDGFTWLDVGVEGSRSGPILKYWDEEGQEWITVAAPAGDTTGMTFGDHTAIGDSNPHHAPVTLAADAQELLNLSTQEIGFVAKAANIVLAGPTTGAAADPTFRGLVAADVPVPTLITVEDEAADTTCFPLFVTAATGNLGPKTNTNWTFNASTGNVGIGTAPAYRLHVAEASTNDNAVGIYVTNTSTTTGIVNMYPKGIFSYITTNIAAGQRNSGYNIGIHTSNMGVAALAGTLDEQYGIWIQHGSYTGCTGTITTAYGLKIDSYAVGTITYKWAIYQSTATFNNYFAGNVTIGGLTGAAALSIVVGGVHVGGTTDPGNDNLLVDGWALSGNCYFRAYANAQSNVTGNNASYKVLFANELSDTDSAFASSTFTAPVTGIYLFQVQVHVIQITAAMTTGFISIVTTGGTYYGSTCNPGSVAAASTDYDFALTIMAPMTAGQTAMVYLLIANGAGNTADITAGSGYTWFSGRLLV